MKMKRMCVWVYGGLVLLTSCSQSQAASTSVKNEEKNVLQETSSMIPQDLAPVDISAVAQRYEQVIAACTKDCEPDPQLVEGIDLSGYDIPRPESAYAIQITEPGNTRKDAYMDVYNALIIAYNIISYHEIYVRAVSTKNEIDVQGLKENIQGFQPKKVKEENMRQLVFDFKEAFVSYFDQVEMGEDVSEELLYDKVQTILNSLYGRFERNFDVRNEKEMEALFSSMDNWKKQKTLSSWERVESARDKEKAFLDAVQEAQSFEEQCAISLAAVKTVSDVVVLPVMRTLLASGKYSRYEYALWRGWRCRCQIFHFGRSRDSVLADELFNEYRMKAYLACMEKLMQVPEDKLACLNMGLILESYNTIRNGDCIFGNDANLDDMDMFSSDY